MVRTGRGSTVKDPLGGSTDKERRGVTHYSYGEGSISFKIITPFTLGYRENHLALS